MTVELLLDSELVLPSVFPVLLLLVVVTVVGVVVDVTDRRSTGDSARDIKKPLPADSDFTRSGTDLFSSITSFYNIIQ
jgi:hypothetical protein